MKKIITLLFVLAGILGFTFVKGTIAQADMLVSPGVWVKGTSAVEEITIHLAYPLSEATEGVDLNILDKNYELFEPIEEGSFTMSADSRGDLVIKFVPEIGKYTIGDSYIVRVTIGEKSWDFTVTIKEAGVVDSE